jgi:type II secretion system protein N
MSAPVRSGWRRGLGYGLFALAAFLLSLYWTFDYSLLIPRFSQLLHQATGSDARIAELSGYHLSGVKIAGLILTAPGLAAGGTAENSLTIDQMTLRVKLLPLLIGRQTVSFTARLAGGGIEGVISRKGQQAKMDFQVKGLILDRVPLSPWLGPGAVRLGGKLFGKADLTAQELANPAKWAGEMEFQLGPGKVYPFKAQGVPVEEISYTRGDLKLKIKDGAANLETLKLLGPDLPLDVKGSISLRAPLSQSYLDITGTVEASADYKKKIPLLTGLLPPEKKFTYQGSLAGLTNVIKSH